MKFTIVSTTLAERMQNVGKVVSNKNGIPALSCFLISIESNVLTLLASDNENMMSTQVEVAESDGDFAFAIEAKMITDVLKDIPEQPITFYYNSETQEVFVDYNSGKFKLVAMPSSEYPVFSGLSEEGTTIQISPSFLTRAVSRALPAASTDELRPVMTGLHFDVSGNEVTIVSSDGHKLVSTTYVADTLLNPASIVLPRKPASFLRSLIGKEESETTLRFTAQSAEFTTEKYTLTCRLIDGRYPPYKTVIPPPAPNKIIVNRSTLSMALRRVLAVASEAATMVKFSVSPEGVKISSTSIDRSTSAEEQLACQYVGEPMQIGFKGIFMQELINNLDVENVVLSLTDPTRACVMTPEVEDEKVKELALLMPMIIGQ